MDDDDGDGDDDDDGGRISSQVQPPHPITPRDEISRSGLSPHSDEDGCRENFLSAFSPSGWACCLLQLDQTQM